MKERPILMTPENAQKVHDGTKTQTRRTKGLEEVNSSRLWDYPQMTRPGVATFLDSTQANPYNNALDVKCPYGQAGDRLWIREAWMEKAWSKKEREYLGFFSSQRHPKETYLNEDIYAIHKGEYANKIGDIGKWKPSIHMPRWACRTVVELMEVKANQLGQISEDDARAEGVNSVAEFIDLWKSIHKIWEPSLLVWVFSFRKVQP